MFEKLGLTQEIGVTLDRIGDLSKGRYAIPKRRGTGGIPCSCPFPPAWPVARSHQLSASVSSVSAQQHSSSEPTLRETLAVHPSPRQSKEVVQRSLGGTHVLFTLQLIELFPILAVGITVVHKFALAIRAFARLEIGLLREDASVRELPRLT